MTNNLLASILFKFHHHQADDGLQLVDLIFTYYLIVPSILEV
jgi:hypothetical protein